MAYSKTNWQDGTTPVDASNLNKIEEALEENSNLITQSIDQPEDNDTLTISNWSSVNIAKRAGIVTITLNFTASFTQNGTWFTLFQLPSGWRPSISFYHNFPIQSGASILIVQIGTNGNVYIQSNSVMESSNWIRQAITFPVS